MELEILKEAECPCHLLIKDEVMRRVVENALSGKYGEIESGMYFGHDGKMPLYAEEGTLIYIANRNNRKYRIERSIYCDDDGNYTPI